MSILDETGRLKNYPKCFVWGIHQFIVLWCLMPSIIAKTSGGMTIKIFVHILFNCLNWETESFFVSTVAWLISFQKYPSKWTLPSIYIISYIFYGRLFMVLTVFNILSTIFLWFPFWIRREIFMAVNLDLQIIKARPFKSNLWGIMNDCLKFHSYINKTNRTDREF